MVVDGVLYEVDWRGFVVGASFFIPCIHAQEAREDVKKITQRLGFRVTMKVVIEDGIRGLRIWRIR